MRSQYPFDASSLTKGSVVSTAEIVEAYGLQPGDEKRLRLALLDARDYVVEEFTKRGVTVTVVIRQDELVVLTDAEATDYNYHKVYSGLDSASRAHRRNQGVDRAELTPSEVAKHDRHIQVAGHVLQAVATAVKQARQMYKPVPVTRQTPGLPKGK